MTVVHTAREIFKWEQKVFRVKHYLCNLIRARNLSGDCPRNPLPLSLRASQNCPLPHLPLIMAAIRYPERGFKFDNYQRYTTPGLCTECIEIFP